MLSGGHDLAFDTPAAGAECGRAPQPRPRFGEEFTGGLLGDLPQRLRGRGWRWVSSEQPAARRAGDRFWFGARHV